MSLKVGWFRVQSAIISLWVQIILQLKVDSSPRSIRQLTHTTSSVPTIFMQGNPIFHRNILEALKSEICDCQSWQEKTSEYELKIIFGMFIGF